jgi:hypothetical protein
MELGAQVHPLQDFRRNQKKCDFRMTLEGREAFVEVSNLRESFEEKWARQTFDAILKHAFSLMTKHPEIEVGGKIYRVLSKPRLAIVKERMSEAFERAALEKVVRIRDEGVCDLDIFQQGERLRDPSLSGAWQGPSFQASGPARIVQKIKTEGDQLPSGKPGFIALYDKNLTLWNLGAELPFRVPAEVCEEVYNHPELAGVAIFQSYQGPSPPKGVEKYEEYSVLRMSNEVLNEEAVLIANRFGINASIADILFTSMTNRAIS